MKLKYYEVDEEKILQEARKGRKIAIKMPEGLQPYAWQILNFLRENGINATLLMESCYGACDFTERKDFDRIICIGEAEMPYLRKVYTPPVSFVEPRYDFGKDFMEDVIPFLKGKRIGMASITPFIHKMDECRKYLERKKYEILIGERGRRTAYNGQILGCDLSSATSIASRVDEFLFIGDGFFHPIGLHIATGKHVVVANPIEKKIYDKEVERSAEKIIKKRYALMSAAMEAEKFGIIVTRKVGQHRFLLAKKMRKMVEKKGRKAFFVFMDNVDESINYLDFDCYISTACPRIAMDDEARYSKPVLTPVEAEIIMGEREWENYQFDQIL